MARRVLHVSQPVEGGVPAVVSQFARDQVRRGWAVGVACPPQGSLPRSVQEAGGWLLPWPARRFPGPTVVSEVARLRRIVAQFAPDLVHLHSSKAGLAGRLAIRGRLPTVFQPHAWSFLAVTGALRGVSVGWERWAARWTDALVCVSREEQQVGLRRGISGRWVVCSNGVDLARFHPPDRDERRAARAVLGLDEAALVVCVGRLSRQKGQDVLLKAWRRVSHSGAVLALVGDGPALEALQRKAGNDVVFAGHCADVRPWYAAATLAVLPSRWDGAALTIREAMACGLSQVVTDVGGIPELIGTCGARVPVDDVESLAVAISTRLHDEALRVREGAAARRVAEQSFDVSVMLRGGAALYDAVLLARELGAGGERERI